VLSAIAASAVCIFGVGAAMSLLTGRRPWLSGGRMLLGAALAATVTFGVGRLLHVSAG
jgi:vacuolar iron transporter family protein